MIHYQLRCAGGHDFDGWFRDSAAFDAQARAGFVECPTCGGTEVGKRLMAPAIPKKGAKRRQEVAPKAAENAAEAPVAAAHPPAPPAGGQPAERAALVAGAFSVSSRGTARVSGRRVLLVDDVMTSGATAGACAEVLLA